MDQPSVQLHPAAEDLSEQPQISPSSRLFVLDTNVLMHDPASIFRFHEHDIYLPMVVLEELDRAKKGASEVARNARQVSRFLDDLIDSADREQIEAGLELSPNGQLTNAQLRPQGHLFLETRARTSEIPEVLPGATADHGIIATALALSEEHPERSVTLVSKDINLRIKARLIGLTAEDYYNDMVLDDVNLLYTGVRELEADFWSKEDGRIECWHDSGSTYYGLPPGLITECYPNECLFQEGDQGLEATVRRVESERVVLERVVDHRSHHNSVWGIVARNREQNFALNLLMDPEIDFVTLLGAAGTGKTLLALAAGLVQTLDQRRYREIVMTRVTVPVGEDIGFLPGTEEEKMTPWMGALLDNLEVLTQSEVGGDWGRAATADLLQKRIKIRSLNFMRGRTFLNRFVIIDEAQNLTSKQMKTLITRAGPGTKVICLGNIAQIDTPYLTETTSGLTYVVDHFKNWTHSGHIILVRGERSRLADFASDRL